MKILNLFGKKEVSDEITKRMPYLIVTEFVLYKLHANRRRFPKSTYSAMLEQMQANTL